MRSAVSPVKSGQIPTECDLSCDLSSAMRRTIPIAIILTHALGTTPGSEAGHEQRHEVGRRMNAWLVVFPAQLARSLVCYICLSVPPKSPQSKCLIHPGTCILRFEI